MKRSKFSLSSSKLLSCKMGQLVPINVLEVLPGDSIQQSTSALVRLSPLLAPVMHPVEVRIHHWYVPNRVLWTPTGYTNTDIKNEGWETFITGGPDPLNATYEAVPSFNPPGGGWGIRSLFDYLGVPPDQDQNVVSALPIRAYQLIYSEFYRDQDLQTAPLINRSGGVDTTGETALQHICWEKDYFTSARPWTQKGPVVTVPLAGEADVVSKSPSGTTGRIKMMQEGGTPGIDDDFMIGNGPGGNAFVRNTNFNAGTGPYVHWGDETGLKALLSTGTAPDINSLREAFGIQRYQEARARYGSRYSEYLRYLGVRSSDARLQRPEYLGGGKQTIQFSEVLQTGVTTDGDDTEGVGNLKGHGIGALRTNRYRRFFEEHGLILTLMSVRPKTIYADGLHKMWTRRTKEDYWQKELQHIGQEEVYNREVSSTHTNPNDVFGYQDRYDTFRRAESTIAGDFRTTLDFWHLARMYAPGADPALNGDFVKCDPSDRIFADQSGTDTLWVMANHSIQARRIIAPVGTSHIF